MPSFLARLVVAVAMAAGSPSAMAAPGTAPGAPTALPPDAAITASPVDLDGIIALRDAGDIQGLERAFDGLQTALVAGEISASRYRRPFLAFRTGNADHAALSDRWVEAMPGSTHAYTARALAYNYVAYLFRGEKLPSRTSRAALQEARDSRYAARHWFETALRLEPDNLMAAISLEALHVRGERSALIDEARRTADRLDDAHSTMRRRLTAALPQWGGGRFGVIRFCKGVAETTDIVTLEACHATARIYTADSFGQQREAMRELQAIDEQRYASEIGFVLASTNMHDDIAPFAERTGHIYPRSRLRNLPLDVPFINEQMEFWTRIDPHDPDLMHGKARMALGLGDLDYARAAIDYVVGVLPHEPEPHVTRGRVYLALNEDVALLDVVEEAAAATEGNGDAMIPALLAILSDPERFAEGPHGAPHDDYQCRLRHLMEMTEDYCEGVGRRPSFCAHAGRAEQSPYTPLWREAAGSFATLDCR